MRHNSQTAPSTLRLIVLCAALVLASRSAVAAEAVAGADAVTTVKITGRILVKDALRLGINTGGGLPRATGVQENFEGTIHRSTLHGPTQDENGFTSWWGVSKEFTEYLKGAKFTILSGPACGQTGTIKEVATKTVKDNKQDRQLTYLAFDHAVPAGRPNTGVLIEKYDLKQGHLSNNTYQCAEQNEICPGDTPPGSFGSSALNLRGAEKPAHYVFTPMSSSHGEPAGLWHVRFWAKVKAGRPKLVLDGEKVPAQQIDLTAEWKQYDLRITVPAEANAARFAFKATGGDVLLDDVDIQTDTRPKNPTAFCDDAVDLLKRLRPGILRSLQMGGNTVDNMLSPPLKRYACVGSFQPSEKKPVVPGPRAGRKPDYGFTEYYTLCEYLGAEPWLNLPGTLQPEELDKFMEYIGAPAETGAGKLRADQGHPKPWTETFRHIYVEFGNEAWNPAGSYAVGGYNGPDYWKGLFERGKKSPHYKPCVVFVAGSQAGSPGVTKSVLASAPNADRVALAPYILQAVSKQEEQALGTDDKLYRWLFAWPLQRQREPTGNVYRGWEYAKAAGVEVALYEHNYHTLNRSLSFGQIGGMEGSSLEFRCRYIASVGGGINVINDALCMMKEKGVRSQCQFTLSQSQFAGVPLWGFVPNISRKDQRYRPVFLAEEIANKAIGGNLVETVQSGANPVFSATGVFGEDSKAQKVTTYENVPTIWSYAFADGNRRGLILVNLDTSVPRPVEIIFDGQPAADPAARWVLTSANIADNNEPEGGEPKVKVKEDTLAPFRSGQHVSLPPFSMTVLVWSLK